MAADILNEAKKNKADEFYTQMADIEAEMRHYRDEFKGKVILCNCDDPYESNFFKYFALNFNHLGLKKLIATSYSGSPVAGAQLSLFDVKGLYLADRAAQPAYKIEISEVLDQNADGAFDLSDVDYLLKNFKNALTPLNNDGDFRTKECIMFLNEADIIVTNPPFSLFREFISQLVDYKKSFLIIGNQNAVTYKEIFRLMRDNKVWLGYNSGDMEFVVPDYYEPRAVRYREENGIKYRSMGNICWYTNLDTKKRHESMTLFKSYSPECYPHYDNYDAINIDKVAEIPYDYDGAMGVPITFLDKYNPEQFEILGITSGRNEFDAIPTKRYINPKQINPDGTVSNGSKANTRSTLLLHEKPSCIYYTADNADGPLSIVYARIVIKRKDGRK
jgi:hypothetical protein